MGVTRIKQEGWAQKDKNDLACADHGTLSHLEKSGAFSPLKVRIGKTDAFVSEFLYCIVEDGSEIHPARI